MSAILCVHFAVGPTRSLAASLSLIVPVLAMQMTEHFLPGIGLMGLNL